MIGVVNPSANETFEAQMEYAEKAQRQLAPGEPWPTESAGDPPSETSDPNPDKSGSGSGEGGSQLGAGAIAGIAIGSAAVLVLAAALIYICGRRGGFDKAYRKSVVPPGGGAGGPQSPMAEQTHAASTMPSANPKSPGQTSFSTYSGAPDHDPYRSHTTSPQHPYFNSPHNGSTPPLLNGGLHPSYAPYHNNTPPQGFYAHPVGELSAQPQYA